MVGGIREGEVVGGTGEGESGERGKGRPEGVARGKRGRVPQPFNISPASKHSNCSTALKNFFLLSPSPLLPSLQAFLFIILDKNKLDHYYIMY